MDNSTLAKECKVKCSLEATFIPTEKIVSIKSVAGLEEVAVSAKSVIEDRLLVAFCLGQKDGTYLVQLPSETTSGRWRIWVPEDQIES